MGTVAVGDLPGRAHSTLRGRSVPLQPVHQLPPGGGHCPAGQQRAVLRPVEVHVCFVEEFEKRTNLSLLDAAREGCTVPVDQVPGGDAARRGDVQSEQAEKSWIV